MRRNVALRDDAPIVKPGDAADCGLPIMDIFYNGLPSTISEINGTPPNPYRADLPLRAAAYGALPGTDGFFFALGSVRLAAARR